MASSDSPKEVAIEQTESTAPAGSGSMSAEQWTALEHGATLKDLYGIPDRVMDTIYACAYERYQNGLLDDARRLFQFLLAQNIYHPDYAFGLAATLHRSKEYAKAANLYIFSFRLKPEARAMLYAGQCYLSQHCAMEAKACFLEAAQCCDDHSLELQIQGYLSALSPKDSLKDSSKNARGEVYG